MDERARRGRLRWRCRRGMRELDVLLERCIDAGALDEPAAQGAFERLLELPDPLLADCLLHGNDPPRGLEEIVERIRANARAATA
jgi:antitoxin CptB